MRRRHGLTSHGERLHRIPQVGARGFAAIRHGPALPPTATVLRHRTAFRAALAPAPLATRQPVNPRAEELAL